MDVTITVKQLIEVVATIVALWGGVKVIKEIVGSINAKHDQVQKWDEYDRQIKEVKSEQRMIIECMCACLDGLGQLGANGKVTETKANLTEYLNNQAHS